jgi:hypothetical protein
MPSSDRKYPTAARVRQLPGLDRVADLDNKCRLGVATVARVNSPSPPFLKPHGISSTILRAGLFLG